MARRRGVQQWLRFTDSTPRRTARRDGHGNGFIDITGQRFGLLVAIRVVGRNPCGTLVWLCQCDCGNQHKVQGTNLRHGRIKACGCRIGTNPPRLSEINWKGRGTMSGAYWSAVRAKIAKLRRRGIASDLSIDQAWAQFEKQGGLCAYTKMALTFARSLETARSLQTASLDRIDSTRGYHVDNIQWVHKVINEMKMDRTHDEFIAFCIVRRN